MSLEAFTGWIKDLVATNPAGGDPKSQGDDHIRGLKATLKQQFSGLTTTTAVTVTAEQINAAPTTANSALARANACLPKDGSEQMTGQLVAPQVTVSNPIAVPESSMVVALGATASRMLVNATSVTHDVFTSAGYQGAYLLCVIDVSGVVSSVNIGRAGVPVFAGGSLPTGAANDAQIVTTQWAQLHRVKPLHAANGGIVAVGGADVLVAASTAFNATSNHPMVAQGTLTLDCTTSGSLFCKLRVVRNSDSVTVAEFVGVQSISAGFTGSVTAMGGFTGVEGTAYVVQLVAQVAAGAGNIAAGRGQLTVQG